MNSNIGNGVEASEKTLLELANNIAKGLCKINMLNSNLSNELTKLGTTFQDDGYLTIQNYICKVQTEVETNQGDLRKICEKLIEYDKIIHDSKKELNS